MKKIHQGGRLSKIRDREKRITGVFVPKTIKIALNDWFVQHQWVMAGLSICALGGMLTIGFVAPNVLGLIGGKSRKNFMSRKQFSFVRIYLKDKGLINLSKDRTHYELTIKGKEKLAKSLSLKSQLDTKIRLFWDHKWRVLVYDVPEIHKNYRDQIRVFAKQFGFFTWQKNVWVYPYADAKKCVEFLHLMYGLGKKDIILFTTSVVFGDDQNIRLHFGL